MVSPSVTLSTGTVLAPDVPTGGVTPPPAEHATAVRATAKTHRRRIEAEDSPGHRQPYGASGRCSNGVDSTTVVRVLTPAFSRSRWRKSSRSDVVRVRTFRM